MIAQGTITETVELSGSPFAAVIAEYRAHARKVIRRRLTIVGKGTTTTRDEMSAILYYIGTADQLERV
jgi:hypothetical protein